MNIKTAIIMGLISTSSICQADNQDHSINDYNKSYYMHKDGTKITINQQSLTTVDEARDNYSIAEIFIAPKDEHNISHNKYDSFRVDANGIILNNQKVAADYIINEVINNGEHSLIEGNIGVKGKSAHVIIANPNGITCDGCSFSNTLSSTLFSGVVQRPNNAVAIYQATPLIAESHPAYSKFNPNRGKVNIINSKNANHNTMFNELNIISNGITIKDKVVSSGNINIFNNYTVMHNFDSSLIKYASPIRGLRGFRMLPTSNYLIIGNKDNSKTISSAFNGNIHSDSAINIYANNTQIKNHGHIDSSITYLSLSNKTNFENHNALYLKKLILDKDYSSTIKNMESGTLYYNLPHISDASASITEMMNNDINNQEEIRVNTLLQDNNFINNGELYFFRSKWLN